MEIIKVIKVIVDELPEMCAKCPFGRYCHDSPTHLGCTVQEYREIENETGRPTWCPLVTYNQAFDWLFFEQKATEYVRRKLEKRFGIESEEE